MRWKRNGTLPWWVLLPLILGLMLSLATSAWVYGAWRIALNAGEYKPGVFVVESTACWHTRRRTYLEARGTIDGTAEKLMLRFFGAKAGSSEALAQEFPRGTRLDVWYDPSASDFLIQGQNLRLLPASYDLKSATRIAATRTVVCNLLAVLGGGLFYGFRSGRIGLSDGGSV